MAVVFGVMVASGCSQEPVYKEVTTVYSPGGKVSDQTSKVGETTLSELHRVFDQTAVTGDGIFENRNEGLARQAALSLAQADLAAKVQTEVKANTVIMNNRDVRSIVESNVNAIIRNYQIDFAGYDQDSDKYRVRISVRGETLVKEIERRLK